MPDNSYIHNYEQRSFNPRRIIALVETLRPEGFAPSRVLDGSGICEADLFSPALRVSYAQIFAVFRNAYNLKGSTDIAFRAGQFMTPASYSLYGYALLSAPTLKHKIEFGLKYQRVSGMITAMDFIEDGEFQAYRYELLPRLSPDDGYYRFLMEFAFSVQLSIMRHIHGTAFHFSSLSARYPEPADVKPYAALFGCPLHFGQDVNELRIGGAWLHRSPRFPDPVTHAMAREICEQQLAHFEQSNSLASMVHGKLMEQLPSNFPNIAVMAASLSMHPKSLQRKLGAEGTSYRALLAEARQQLAIHYLSKSRLSIDQIAGRLGYSDATNFRHAFSRWTGRKPSSYR